MPALKSGTILPSDKEDADITLQAIEDDTNHTNEDLAIFRPVNEFKELQAVLKAAGRPNKKPVSIRLSPEVVDYFKGTGKGWQTRVDEILKDYVAHH